MSQVAKFRLNASDVDGTTITVSSSGVISATGATTSKQVVKRTATATDYVVLTTDYYIGVTSTGAPRAITLPATAVAGQIFAVKDESGGAATNNITVSVSGGVKTIDGAATVVINGNYDAYSFIYDGTNYFSY